jgi:hypothetical protein
MQDLKTKGVTLEPLMCGPYLMQPKNYRQMHAPEAAYVVLLLKNRLWLSIFNINFYFFHTFFPGIEPALWGK